MPKPQIPTVRKGAKPIAAAIGISVSQLYAAMKDPSFPVNHIGRTPFMDVKAFRQWLGVKFEAKGLSKEEIRAEIRQYVKEKLGEG